LEDEVAREKIMRFDHERIPERVVHARGSGAHGYFKLHKAIPEFSHAGVLNDTGRVTPIFMRFSTVQGSRGSADTVRDVRGFAVKFYTEEGNWDIVGNDIPVFFIQDAMKFPDVIHAVKPGIFFDRIGLRISNSLKKQSHTTRSLREHQPIPHSMISSLFIPSQVRPPLHGLFDH
jgi:hypothetical protein